MSCARVGFGNWFFLLKTVLKFWYDTENWDMRANREGIAENINVYISTKAAPITIETVNLKELFRMVREEIAPQLSIRKVKWSQSDYLPEIKADRLAMEFASHVSFIIIDLR